MSPILYPTSPVNIPEFAQFHSLTKNWDFSRDKLSQLNERLNNLFGENASFSVAVVGSYGRMEACEASDLDFIILSSGETSTDGIYQTIKDVALELDIPFPNADGVFSKALSIEQLIDKIGHRDDDLPKLAQRMLLLMESKAIYNELFYKEVVQRILDKYLGLIGSDSSKEAVFLLNDLIRYFRSIAVNYQYNFWKENEKWTIRSIKFRHSRVLIYAGLLFLIMNASKAKNKSQYITDFIYHTPFEKIVSVYADNNDTEYVKLLGMYDIFIGMLSDNDIREQLQVDYEQRFTNGHYSKLKATSDAFISELTRFVFAQRGNWHDHIYEYLIF